MRGRLEVESVELAESFRAADADVQQRVAEQIVQRALATQDPPLELPTGAALQAVVDELDASEDEADFRRARAAAAVLFMRQAAYEDALYEAIHAHVGIEHAVREALAVLR